MLQFSMGENLNFQLGGIALVTLIGILLNAILPNKQTSEEAATK